MPGIVGVISQIRTGECESLVHSMISCMEYETFYVSGTHFVPEMGIYAGWVALEGSFAAQQVFTNDRKDIVVVFAGECLPGSESQAVRGRNGNQPDDKSWLVRLYEEQGDNFFEKLNGLFSGLLIDKRRKRGFLFNDRYGLERLYVCDTKEGFYFASEAKALLQVLPELRRFDEVGVTQFLTFGCTLEWQTLFRGLELLPGGSLCVFEAGSFRRGRYFSSASWESLSPATEEVFESKFEKRFKRILPYYCQAEPRVGIALTGGLDTRMIMACLPETEKRPVSYTFTGESPTILDSKLAGRVAAACGFDHRNLQIGSDFFADFPAIADQTVYVTDGCFGITGAHEIYFNRKARQLAPTRLTGNFGSEILRGISTFKPLGLSRHLFHKDVNHAVDSCATGLGKEVWHPVSFAAFREIPWSLFGSLAAGRSQVTFRTPYLDNELVALAFQAPEHLRRSSVAALNLVKGNKAALGAIPTDRGRGGSLTGPAYFLRRLFCDVTFKLDYIYSESLPGVLAPFDALIQYGDAIGITGLHKFLRYRRWFRTKLRAYLEQALADARARQLPFWNVNFLERMAAEHVSGRKNYLREINAVLTLAATDRLILHKRF
jgi:asparagine synthase (glutamine-hydrolysing)